MVMKVSRIRERGGTIAASNPSILVRDKDVRVPGIRTRKTLCAIRTLITRTVLLRLDRRNLFIVHDGSVLTQTVLPKAAE